MNSCEVNNKQYEEKGKLEEVLLIHNLKNKRRRVIKWR